MIPRLLHENILADSLMGERIIKPRLEQLIGEAAMAAASLPHPDDDLSIVIRSRNNAAQLEGLLEDIRQQNFDGEVEVLLVDTESTDGTVELAKKFGAEIINITQNEFNYPLALNKGFEAASHDWVFSFVDHSLLTNTEVLRTATRAQEEGNIAGISGIVLPNSNATWPERVLADIPAAVHLQKKSPYFLDKISMGNLAANAAAYRRDVWQDLGGFDEAYGAGGEDVAFARTALEKGYEIIADPVISVHHSHGVGLIDNLKQLQYASRILHKPLPFDRSELEKFRSDLG